MTASSLIHHLRKPRFHIARKTPWDVLKELFKWSSNELRLHPEYSFMCCCNSMADDFQCYFLTASLRYPLPLILQTEMINNRVEGLQSFVEQNTN